MLESIAGKEKEEEEEEKEEEKKKKKNPKKRLIVQTVENDPILRRFLQLELFPSIQFLQHVALSDLTFD